MGSLFADDFGLKVACDSRFEVDQNLVQSSLILKDWCSANNLSLNSEKISDMFFTYNSSLLKVSDSSPLKLDSWASG